jgi:hypothetical protein
MKRKIFSFIAISTMILSLAGCGASYKDAKSVLDKVNEATGEIKSSDIAMSANFAMTVDGQEMVFDVNADATSFADSLKSKVSMDVDVKLGSTKVGIEDAEVYTAEEGDNLATYVGVDLSALGGGVDAGTTGKQWTKQLFSKEIMEQSKAYSENEALKDIITEISDKMEMEEVEEDGKKLFKMTGKITSKNFTDILDAVGLMDQIEQVMPVDEETQKQFDELVASFGEIPFIMYVDKESFQMTKVSVDASDSLKSMADKLMSLASETEGVAGTELKIDTFKMDFEYKSINQSKDFEIPQEALNAEDIDVSQQLGI